jgi:hypothetical protein
MTDHPRKHIAVVVFVWPDDSLTTQAADWLAAHFPRENIFRVLAKGPIDVVRANTALNVCLKMPPHVTEFLWMDRDMRPDPAGATQPFLEADGDVVACEYPAHNPRAWAQPTALHLGLVRIKRLVFETLAAERDERGQPVPLFAFPRAADNTHVLGCECGWFAQRVLKAGLKIVRAGWCGHGTPQAACA